MPPRKYMIGYRMQIKLGSHRLYELFLTKVHRKCRWGHAEPDITGNYLTTLPLGLVA